MLAISASLAVTPACGGGDEVTPTGLTPGGVQPTAGTPNPQPSQFFEHLEGALPAGFPEDFPIYTPAEIARGDTLDTRYAIDLRSTDEMGAVVKYYRDGLSTLPWQITDEEPGEGSIILTYESKDGAYHGEVAIGKLQERTWILILLVPGE